MVGFAISHVKSETFVSNFWILYGVLPPVDLAAYVVLAAQQSTCLDGVRYDVFHRRLFEATFTWNEEWSRSGEIDRDLSLSHHG